ncbi:glycosyltransferase family 2 protein [Patescibacteria group bacterium]|nr:glycosyltransferase family 2 protein [Patescibacteria group bacterium]
MKLVVQIPCLNEEATLPLVLQDIPKRIPGIKQIEVLVIDDGSTDKTVEVAKRHGVKHFILHRRNMGLARSFHDGVNKALELKADILVSTDGDNQYPQQDISKLVKPVLDGRAEIVIGDRQTKTIAHFSWMKKVLQRWGSAIVNRAGGTDIPDAASGFRAYSREALFRLNVVTRFSYCMETIIQAGIKKLAIVSVPIKTNEKLRESRLYRSTGHHVTKSALAIIRSYLMYKPYAIFITLGIALLLLGLIPFGRYLWLLSTDPTPGGHLQSLILGSVLLVGSFLSFIMGVISDLIRTTRILQEDELERLKRIQYRR